MIRLNPTITHDAAWWDRMYAEGKGQRWTIWKDPDLIKAAATRIERLSTILLVACGTGHAAESILRFGPFNPGHHFSGIDFSTAPFEWEGPLNNILRHDLDVYPWPFMSGHFRVAICSEILESLDDPTAAVRECQRIARRTMITLPISMDLLSEGHKWLFERSDAEALLPGCEVVELRGGKLLACFQR